MKMGIFLIFTLAVLIAFTNALEIRLHNQRYKQLFADAHNILEQRQSCHVHLLIMAADNFGTSLSFPHYLTVPDGKGYNVSSIGDIDSKSRELYTYITNLAFPSLTTYGTCLVNAFIITETWIPSPVHLVSLKMFMLKQRSNSLIAPIENILLHDSKTTKDSWAFEDRGRIFFVGFLWDAAGAAVTYLLVSDDEIRDTANGSNRVDSKNLTILCPYCEKSEDLMPCATGNGQNCFEENYQSQKFLLNEGNNIKWLSRPLLVYQWVEKPAGKWATCELLRHESKQLCVPHITLTLTVSDFLTQSLHSSSRLAYADNSGYQRQALPRIMWTKDGFAELDYFPTWNIH